MEVAKFFCREPCSFFVVYDWDPEVSEIENKDYDIIFFEVDSRDKNIPMSQETLQTYMTYTNKTHRLNTIINGVPTPGVIRSCDILNL